MKIRIKKKPEPPKCRYNDGVVCWLTEKICDRCGWCPAVEQRRNEQLQNRSEKVRP